MSGSGWGAVSVVLPVTWPGKDARELGVPVSLPLRACIPSEGVVERSLSVGIAYHSKLQFFRAILRG